MITSEGLFIGIVIGMSIAYFINNMISQKGDYND